MTTYKTRKGDSIKILDMTIKSILAVGIELTRMTAKSGKTVYAVVIRNVKNGRRVDTYTYERIADAWKQYKAALA